MGAPREAAVRLVRNAGEHLINGRSEMVRMAAMAELNKLGRGDQVRLVTGLAWVAATFAARVPLEEREQIFKELDDPRAVLLQALSKARAEGG